MIFSPSALLLENGELMYIDLGISGIICLSYILEDGMVVKSWALSPVLLRASYLIWLL